MVKILFFVNVLTLLIGCSGESKEGLVRDSGRIDVYFCPRDDCETGLVRFLNSAMESIDCAFFELNLDKVIYVLNGKNKYIPVRLVIDGDNAEDVKGLDFVKLENRSAYMHNKFCIVDNKRIMTGSMNPTVNGVDKNNNNMVLIESSVLAGNYLDEFEELWQGIYGKGGRVKVPELYLNNKLIENYFCPEDNCAYEIKGELGKAKTSIYFMTFSFTHDGIANTILLRSLDGVKIGGIFENRGSGTEESKFNVFQYQGFDVIKDKNKGTMHHKVFIIDGKTIILGSFNPSKNADERNDENILIIHDPDIAKKFLDEFVHIWKLE